LIENHQSLKRVLLKRGRTAGINGFTKLKNVMNIDFIVVCMMVEKTLVEVVICAEMIS